MFIKKDNTKKNRKVETRIVFKPIKRLGQNFIFDKKLISRIINKIPIEEDSIVIEIGSGYGIFTQMLIEKTKCYKVFGLEKDERLFKFLIENVSSNKIAFLFQDALNFDWISFLELNNFKRPIRIVGNLPYNIANSLIIELLLIFSLFTSFAFLVQKEVAYRWIAKPKSSSYSALSVFVNFLSITNICFKVSGMAFSPKSSVQGALVIITIKKEIPIETSELKSFWVFLRNCFQFRRKTLLNNLIRFVKNIVFWKEYFTKKGYSMNLRPTDLSSNEYWDFFIFFKETENKLECYINS